MKLLFIEAARGIAVVLVVVSHASGADFSDYGWNVWIKPAGQAAVDFFFVLSGFIIPYASLGKTGHLSLVFDYARRRFIRIYPTYWLISSTTLITALAVPHLANLPQFKANALLASFLILPQSIPPLLPVAWTLEHEMIFYVLFGVFVASHRWGVVGFSLWGGYILGANTFGEHFLPAVFSSWHNAYFFVGLAAVAFAGRIPDFPVPRFLVLIGESSYPIYLIHLNVLVVLFKLTRGALPSWLMFMVLVSGGVAAGVGFHLVVERPLLRFLRKKKVPIDRAPYLGKARKMI